MANESNGNGLTNIILKTAVALLSAAVLSLFTWVWSAQSSLTTLSLQMETMVTQSSLTELSLQMQSLAATMAEVKEDTETDTRQDDQLSKHWKLHSWARHAINELERAGNKELSQWPNFGP